MARQPGPERTCVGCRAKAAKSTLLRVVGVRDQGTASLTPDPAGRLPGRGAFVHLDPRCVDLAEKRRAFPRALRLAGPLDVTSVRAQVAGLHALSRSNALSPSNESGSTAE
jgi:predicted RNA-binding protein YlxR (DUF448 family)